MERPAQLNVCLNCNNSLSVKLTTGLEENRDGQRGSFDVISAASDACLQHFASALHQSVSGAWNQYTIF